MVLEIKRGSCLAGGRPQHGTGDTAGCPPWESSIISSIGTHVTDTALTAAGASAGLPESASVTVLVLLGPPAIGRGRLLEGHIFVVSNQFTT